MNNTKWILLFAAAAAATFVLGFLIASISERRAENLRPTQVMITPIGEWETDPAVWGRNFPREYDSWKRTLTNDGPTPWGGSEPLQKLDKFKNLRALFAGYGFALDYKEDRGHGYAVQDATETLRVRDDKGGFKAMPGTCYTCKSPDVPRLMHELSEGGTKDGVAAFYKTPFKDLVGKVKHSISCLDCHDPKTMDLRISRPAFVEAMHRRGVDVAQATHQQMRTYVCAQCHVEYYFKGEGKYLTFPWDKNPAKPGPQIDPINVDQIVTYYQDSGFADWTHPVSKTPMIKMQHPDFELYTAGIHAARGVSCADCHMPYRSEGGVKVTDHHVKSPLLGNVAVSCQVCHRWGENEIKARVVSIQNTTVELMTRAEEALIAAHNAVGEAMKAGCNDDELKAARNLIRESQARWDFIAAENSTGFHAPQETARILGASIDQARQAELMAVRLRLGKTVVAK